MLQLCLSTFLVVCNTYNRSGASEDDCGEITLVTLFVIFSKMPLVFLQNVTNRKILLPVHLMVTSDEAFQGEKG